MTAMIFEVQCRVKQTGLHFGVSEAFLKDAHFVKCYGLRCPSVDLCMQAVWYYAHSIYS